MYNFSFSLASSTLIFVFKCKINLFTFIALKQRNRTFLNTFSSRLNLYVYEILLPPNLEKTVGYSTFITQTLMAILQFLLPVILHQTSLNSENIMKVAKKRKKWIDTLLDWSRMAKGSRSYQGCPDIVERLTVEPATIRKRHFLRNIFPLKP